MDPPSIPPKIDSFPAEILGDIFSHCLPDFPLDEVQSNTRIAPMLLCHVCSLWRTIALANPTLWSHLSIRLPIRMQLNKDSAVWDWKAFLTVMEFMGWWRDNQGSVAPFIRIQLNEKDGVEASPLTSDLITLFTRYLILAQYVDIPNSLLTLFLREDRTERRFYQLGPNLHTLLVNCGQNDDDGDDPTILVTPWKIRIPSALRRLSIGFGTIKVSVNWSELTHLALTLVSMRPNVWLSLIRGLPNLQWGSIRIFDISGELEPTEYHAPMVTLPRLRALILNVNIPFKKYAFGDTPVLFFMNLYLPALCSLSIQSVMHTGRESTAHCVVAEIKNLLRSAPGITKLELGPVLCFVDSSDPPSAEHPDEACSDIEPLLLLAPNLSHLQMNIPFEMHGKWEEGILESFTWWCKSFSVMHWIDLDNPQIAIQKITIVVKTIDQNTSFVEALIGEKLTSFVEGYKEKSQDIEFEIIWEEQDLERLPSMDTRRMWS